jgi:hypothetical protein
MIIKLKNDQLPGPKGAVEPVEKERENKPPDLCTHLNWNIRTMGSNAV